jgi:hypothetical protein
VPYCSASFEDDMAHAQPGQLMAAGKARLSGTDDGYWNPHAFA